MAIGDTIAPKGHVPKLQPSPKLHKPSPEPEPPRLPKPEPNPANEREMPLLSRRALEEDLGDRALGLDHDRLVHVEVRSVHGQRRFPRHGLLPRHGQRSGRDVEVQHGSHFVARL